MIPTSWFLILGAILFTIGVMGVLTRKNGITIFMSIELMVNAVNLTFLAYARQFGQLPGAGGDVRNRRLDVVIDPVAVPVLPVVLFPVNELFGLVHVRLL